MKDKQTLHQRNEDILDEVSAMLAEKSPRGNQKYTMAYIYDIVGERHDLQSRTVKNIFSCPAADADIRSTIDSADGDSDGRTLAAP